MSISRENLKIRESILGFERRIEDMHVGFQRYRSGEQHRMPDWQNLEREMLVFSRRKLIDLELSKQLDRVLYKFQNRKKIWLAWVDEVHHSPGG